MAPTAVASLLAVVCIFSCTGAEAQNGEPRAAIPSITVDGNATREVSPDMAVVSVGVTTDRPTAADAAAQNSRTAAALFDEIKAAGVPEHDVQTIQSSLVPVFDTDRSGAASTKIKGFHAANVVEIRVHDLALVGPLVGRLIDKGANALQGVDFTFSNPTPLLDDMRADATRDAKRKAQIYADAAGVRLGRILNIAPESSPVMPMQMAAARKMKSDSIIAVAPAPMPLQPGQQSLESRVGITWELVQ